MSDVTYFKKVELFLSEGKTVKITVKGKSMHPFIREGSTVSLERATRQRCRNGVVLLAKWKGKYVLHRLVGIDNSSKELLLAGDANLDQIERVAPKEVIAVATCCFVDENKGKTLLSWKVRYLGLIWYYLRTVRRVFAYLTKN